MVNSFSIHDSRPGVARIANFLSLQLLPWEDPTNWINAINRVGEKEQFKGWENDADKAGEILEELWM